MSDSLLDNLRDHSNALPLFPTQLRTRRPQIAAQRPLLVFADTVVNLGDLALLQQSVSAGRIGGRKVYVRQWATPPHWIAHQVSAFGCTIVPGKSILHIIRLSLSCDAVIGGGQIVRNNVSVASLVFMLISLLAVRLGGGTVACWGLGVSAISRPILKWLWRLILALSDAIRVRDAISVKHTRALMPKAKIVETGDMAFLDGALHDQLNSALDGKKNIVIAPCIEVSESRSIDGEGFSALLACVKKRFPHATISVACHDPRPEIDCVAADKLITRYGLSPEAKICDGSLQELCKLYRNAHLVITNRLHAGIFGLLAGASVIVVDDGSGKLRAFSDNFGLQKVSSSAILSNSAIENIVAESVAFDAADRQVKLRQMQHRALKNLGALQQGPALG